MFLAFLDVTIPGLELRVSAYLCLDHYAIVVLDLHYFKFIIK